MQTRNEAEVRRAVVDGHPVPGSSVRRTRRAENDIELLIVVTPHWSSRWNATMPQCDRDTTTCR